MAEDTRRLIPMSIKKLEDNLWNIKIDGAESYNVEGDFDSIKKVLRRIKAKDGAEYGKCRSSKKGTYASMLGDIDNNELHKINVWKSKVPHSPEDFKKLMESRSYDDLITLDGVSDNVEYYIGIYEENGTLSKVQLKDLYNNLDILWINNMYPYFYNLGVEILNKCGYKNNFDFMKESKEMKTITLTKNYILEGQIIPKGTIIELKEKLDFLPADVWEKAKTIEDKHERFEFVKAELNKLGDNYSDDEVEEFLNKYENDLKESKKSIKEAVEGLGDMLDMLEETLVSEDKVAKEDIEKVLDEASGDEKLLKAWEDMSKADDKTFNKKENAFWKVFDEICKKYNK